MNCEVVEVREKKELAGLDGLIIPGGESTTLSMLMQRAGIFEEIKKVRKLFGTCAGAIMLSKHVEGKERRQKFLELLDVKIKRNAIWPQVNSCEAEIETKFGKVNAIFIRAPEMLSLGKNVEVLAKYQGKPIAVYEKLKKQHFLAATFHPELTTTKFHEFFLKL